MAKKFCKWKANTEIVHARTPATPEVSQIIADHTIIADYDKIPEEYITEVKKMWINIMGESHSQAYRTGLSLLEAENESYAVNVVESGNPDSYTADNLRCSRAFRTQYSSWEYGTGEASWYTWFAATPLSYPTASVRTHTAYCEANSYGKQVIGFGWCWDMNWGNAVTEEKDPVYGCGWAGTSVGGPDDNLQWGLDADDFAITNNHVCLDTYLQATQNYIDYCTSSGYATQVIFTTGTVDGYTGETGYQGYLKNERIRDYVLADSSRILFDYADILCYDDNGTPTTSSWNDHTYPVITTTNLGDGSIGHIGSAGALRLGKAQWWLLARIAGWDGN